MITHAQLSCGIASGYQTTSNYDQGFSSEGTCLACSIRGFGIHLSEKQQYLSMLSEFDSCIVDWIALQPAQGWMLGMLGVPFISQLPRASSDLTLGLSHLLR